jgi:hypothetical protein
MKKYTLLTTSKYLVCLLSLFCILIGYQANCQSIGLGTTQPALSAKLEISSTTQGILLPRITIIQRNAIAGPVAGFTIYCMGCEELQVFNGYY